MKDHPEMAGNPDNITFVTRREHLDAHGGIFRNKTEVSFVNRKINGE